MHVASREGVVEQPARSGSTDHEPARKAQAVALTRRMNVREAAQAAISEAHAQFVANVGRLADDFEPELVHQTRVALRRLRVYLRMFRAQIGKKRARRLAAELRWLFAALGRLRDLQVFEQTYLTRAETARPATALHGRLRGSSELAKQELRTIAAGARFDRLCHALDTLVAELAVAGADGKQVRRWLARKLDREHERVLALKKALHEARADDLHELRKRLKKLRYAAELGASLYPKRQKRVDRYLRKLRRLQDVLGGFMDQEVARQVLGQLAAPAGLRRTLSVQLDHEANAQLAELARRFPPFANVKPFWQ